MDLVAIIPVHFRDLFDKNERLDCIRYFEERKVPYIVAVNGCDIEAALKAEEVFLNFTYIKLMWAGEEGHPYVARNKALQYATRVFPRADAFALIDSDTEISPEWLEVALRTATRDSVINGRVKTRVPRGISQHLDWLSDSGFECFDGFTPKGGAIGANMIIGRNVWVALGLMSEEYISGGDCAYAVAAVKCGFALIDAPSMVVYKVITKYSYRTIIDKQLRRACSADPALLPPVGAVLEGLRGALMRHHDAIAIIEDLAQFERSPDYYAMLIDGLFGIMWFEGMLSRHIDSLPVKGKSA